MTEFEKKDLLLKIENDRSLMLFLNNEGYKKVAICGYREFGRVLYDRLKDCDFEISFIIERNYESLRMTEDIDVPIVGFKDIQYQADVVIITPDLDYELVKECINLAGIEISVILLTDIIMG